MSACRILSATRSPETPSRARKTDPMPPRPAARSISNRSPTTRPGVITSPYGPPQADLNAALPFCAGFLGTSAPSDLDARVGGGNRSNVVLASVGGLGVDQHVGHFRERGANRAGD